MTLAGTTTVYEGVLATEVVKLALDTYTGMTWTSSLSEVYGCVITGASDISAATAVPYYTLSGRTITFELGADTPAEAYVFVTVYGRK